MKATTTLHLFGALVLVSGVACGHAEGDDEPGSTLEINFAAHDAWPTGVLSARIKMDRTGGATGCGTAASTFNLCWCVSAGAGCDFDGDPPPASAVNSLCSGSWTLDSATSAAYSATACATSITTTESISPDPVTLPYGGSASVTVTFQGSSSLNVDVGFDG